MTNTRSKFSEAAYFLMQMKATPNDKDVFQHNLSAFLSAFRSITLFMQKEYARTPNFATWYAQQQATMKADTILSFFNSQRVLTIHEKPVATRPQYQYYTPSIDLSKLVPGERLTFTLTTNVDESGRPAINISDVTDRSLAIASEASAMTEWLFDDLSQQDNPDNNDVLTLCQVQLDKIEARVSDCEQAFPTPQ